MLLDTSTSRPLEGQISVTKGKPVELEFGKESSGAEGNAEEEMVR